MLKILPILLLVAAVQSDESLDSVFKEIFGFDNKDGANQEPDLYQPCKLLDGREGPCVKYDQPVKREQHNGCGWTNPTGFDLKTEGKAQFGEFPWMVAILNVELVDEKKPDGEKINVFTGTGSLIHPSIVLTAAHYVTTGKTQKIRAGEWDAHTTKEIYPHQDRDVMLVEPHENFDEGQRLYDIAVVFVNKPFDLAPNVGLACLPPQNFHQKEGSRCIGTGWGKELVDGNRRYTAIPKKIELPVIEHDKCQEALRKSHEGSVYELHPTFICAGGESGKEPCWYHGVATLSCPIDSQTDRYVQTGITAWGVECEKESTPGVFVEVSALRDWIDNKVLAKAYDPKTYTY